MSATWRSTGAIALTACSFGCGACRKAKQMPHRHHGGVWAAGTVASLAARPVCSVVGRSFRCRSNADATTLQTIAGVDSAA